VLTSSLAFFLNTNLTNYIVRFAIIEFLLYISSVKHTRPKNRHLKTCDSVSGEITLTRKPNIIIESSDWLLLIGCLTNIDDSDHEYMVFEASSSSPENAVQQCFLLEHLGDVPVKSTVEPHFFYFEIQT